MSSATDAALDVLIDRMVRAHATQAEAAHEIHLIINERWEPTWR
jgi:hypothetical protein